MGKILSTVLLLTLTGCIRYASDPMSLAPSNPSATWTPLHGNRLVCSQFCNTIVPPSFDAKELNLAELIDIALQNNPATQQTWAQARVAAAQYGQGLSQFFPNVSFNGSMFRQKATFIDTDGAPQPYFATQIGPDLQLTFTLFDFGQRTAASLAARESLYYADWTHNQEIQIVIQIVMDSYYQYLYEKASLEAQIANLENAQMTLDVANEKFLVGVAALGDVAQARSQFFQNKMDLTSQKQSVESSFARLASQLGLPANIPFQVTLMPDEIESAPLLENVDELVALAQTHRQDFLAAQANIRAQEALLLNAKRTNLPVVSTSLDAGYYWFDHHRSEKFIHWSALFSLTFPIFDGFRNRNAIKAAEAKVKYSQAVAMQTELGIIQDVTVAHSGVKTAAANLNDSVEFVKSAQLQFEIALAHYKLGTATILDVVTAQTNLANARTKFVGTKRDWFVSLASLAYATGSLCAHPDEVSCID